MPNRHSRGAQNWEKVPRGRAFARPCPKCGAAAYARCLRVRGANVTGNGDEGAYLVHLKTFHLERQRRTPPEPESGSDAGEGT